MGNQLFRGCIEPIAGTAVCFAESTDCDSSDGKKKLSFIAKTDKVLQMKRVFLKSNMPSQQSESSQSEAEPQQ